MTDNFWRQHEDEQRQREASLTLGQKLAWLDDAIETATMLGWQAPKRDIKASDQRQACARHEREQHVCEANFINIDTIAEATLGDKFIIATIAQWTIERRAVALNNLTAMVRASSRRAWRERHPEQTTQDADIDWAASQYGVAIGAGLRSHLAKRRALTGDK